MHERRIAVLALLLMLAFARPAASEPPDDWKPGDARSGPGFSYQVFSHRSEGEGFVRYQVRGTIDAEPEALVGGVRVIAGDPARAPKGQKRRLISNAGDEFVVYSYIDLPALFSDRDIVTRGVSSADATSGGRRIDWRAIDHAEAPRVDGAVRIERSAGFWVFEPAGARRSRVTYETYVDLGGSLPGWLVQGMMGGTVAETYENLAREVVRP